MFEFQREKNVPANMPLRKHAYSNILNISTPKPESFRIKFLVFFSYFFSKHSCGYSLEPHHRGGFNEYSQSMFLSRNKKNNAYPINPSFTI